VPIDREASQIVDALGVSEWASLRDGVDHAGDYLRRATPAEGSLAQIGERLGELAAHPKWEVRKSVAHALLYLRHDSFHAAIAGLLKDDNTFVRGAAERTMGRRSEANRSDLLREEHTNMLSRNLADLEARFGFAVRPATMKVAEKHTEMVMRGVHHEVVKPLTAIDAALEKLDAILRRDKLDRDAAQAVLHTARGRVKFLSAIIDSLREQMREVMPEYTFENLRALVEEAVSILRDRVRAKVGDLAVQVDVDPALSVEASRHHLLQALLNLLVNAVEAYDGMEQTRRITIAAAVEDGARVAVRIADSGCGMSQEALSDAFKLFSSKKADGLGFGLPYTKKMIENVHHGAIRLVSEKGKGTTVTIVLPLEQEQR
jgi:signal transduction histidine kinase